jgi:hypothetical protein
MGALFSITVLNFGMDVLHIISGSLLVLIVFLHTILHWRWVKGLVLRWKRVRLSDDIHAKGALNRYNNILMGMLFLLSSLTGSFLIFVDSRPLSGSHVLFSFLFLVSVSIHAVAHYRWILAVIRVPLQSLLFL